MKEFVNRIRTVNCTIRGKLSSFISDHEEEIIVIRKILRITTQFFLAIVFLAWFVQFFKVFQSAVLNSGWTQVIQFSQVNIEGAKITALIITLLICLRTLTLILTGANTVRGIFLGYVETSFNYLISILEIIIGAYIGAIFFVIEFIGYDPRFVLLLNGLVAFYVLEKIKGFVTTRYFSKTIEKKIKKIEEKTEESLYVTILLWAYSKHVKGFTENELFTQFDFNNQPETLRWYLRVFRNGTNDNPPMIDHFLTRADIGYWCLTEKGMSAAVDYLELKETRESSKQAMTIAVASLILATIVGVAQILVQIFVK